MFLERILGLFVADDLPRDGFLVRLCVRPLHRSHRKPFPILALSFNMGVNGKRVLGLPVKRSGNPRQLFSQTFHLYTPVGNSLVHNVPKNGTASSCGLRGATGGTRKMTFFGSFTHFWPPPTHFFRSFFTLFSLFAPRPFQRHTTRPAAGRISRG